MRMNLLFLAVLLVVISGLQIFAKVQGWPLTVQVMLPVCVTGVIIWLARKYDLT